MVNPKGFPSFPQPERGGKGGGDFLFKAPKGPLFGSPFPPCRPQGGSLVPAAADLFSFCFFFFYLQCLRYLSYVSHVICLIYWRCLYVAKAEKEKAGRE